MRRYAPIALAILVWGWTTIFIKLLQERGGFDPFTQNFYRYLAAVIVLLAASRWMNPAGFAKAIRRPWVFVLPGLALAGFQTLWVLGIYRVTPAYATIVGDSDMLMVMLVAVFFADERRLVKNPRFVLSMLIGLAAVIGFVAFDPRARFGWTGGASGFFLGTTLVVVGSALWVVYAYLGKWLVRDCGAMILFSFSAVFATLALLGVCWVAGSAGIAGVRLGRVTEVAWPLLLLLFGSGVLNAGIGQALFNESVRRIGVSLTQALGLIVPLFTALYSFFIFGERLTAWQWGCGLVLLVSLGYLTILDYRTQSAIEARGVAVPPAPPGD